MFITPTDYDELSELEKYMMEAIHTQTTPSRSIQHLNPQGIRILKAKKEKFEELNKSKFPPNVVGRPQLPSPSPSPSMSRSQVSGSGAAPSFHFPVRKPRPPPPVPRICFVPDTLPASIQVGKQLNTQLIPPSLLFQDVGTAVVPASSSDPFLNSFFAFCHDRAPEHQNSSNDVQMITYERPELRELSEDEAEDDDVFVDEDDTEDIEEVPDTDPLMDHITSSGLPLRLRRPTLSDGNCWWDATADQVRCHFYPDCITT